MRLQLQHVFAGVAMRRRKVQSQDLVHHLGLRVAKRQIGGVTGLQYATTQGLGEGSEVFATHAHDAHGTPAWRGGNGHDGGFVLSKHMSEL